MKTLAIFIPILLVFLGACQKEDLTKKEFPALSTIAPTNIGPDSALSGGIITREGGSAVTARGVCWDSLTGPTIANDKTEDGAGIGDFTSKVTGLMPGKTYYLRAYATNQAGTNYGDEVVFTTTNNQPGVYIDPRDGNSYRIVIIGSQVWMAENLRYLPEVHNNAEFDQRSAPGYGVYGYDGNDLATAKAHPNYATYGVLYNWPAASTAAPPGWHLASAAEWDELESFIRSDSVVPQGWEGNALKATSGWNCGVPGTDNYGFTALAGGVRNSDGLFFDIGLYSDWWTSTEAGFPNGANYRALVCTYGLMDKGATSKYAGYYVRCVKD